MGKKVGTLDGTDGSLGDEGQEDRQGGEWGILHIIPLLPENGTNVMNYDVTIYRREGGRDGGRPSETQRLKLAEY